MHVQPEVVLYFGLDPLAVLVLSVYVVRVSQLVLVTRLDGVDAESASSPPNSESPFLEQSSYTLSRPSMVLSSKKVYAPAQMKC